MPVRFCVVPSARAAAIEENARRFAAMDPNGRAVVVEGDRDYPQTTVDAAIANVADAGAVVLTGNGAVFRILNIDDAENGGIVDRAFSEARLA